MRKRIIALVLAFLMIMNVVPTSAFAANEADTSITVCGNDAVVEDATVSESDAESPRILMTSTNLTQPVVLAVEEEETDSMVGKRVKIASDASRAWPVRDISNVNDTVIVSVSGYAEEMVVMDVETVNGVTYYQLNVAKGYSWPADSLMQDGYWLDCTKLEVIEDTESCGCACENCTGAEGCECGCENCQFYEPVDPEDPEISSLTHPETGVEVSAESFSEGVTLEVSEANVESLLSEFEIPTSKMVFGLDISLLNADSSEYQPGGALVKIPVGTDAGPYIGIIHNHNGDITFMGVTEVLSDGTMEFYTDNFSEFAGFTVDFHYNGVDYSIEGLTSILLSKLFENMGINEDAYTAENVVFSDNSLVTTERQDGGDWLLTSLEAFQTEETLIITFTGGRTIVIDVTDASWKTSDIWGEGGSIRYQTAGAFQRNVTVTIELYEATSTTSALGALVSTSDIKMWRQGSATISIPDDKRGGYWYYGAHSGCDTFNVDSSGYSFEFSLEDSDGATIKIRRIPYTIKKVEQSDNGDPTDFSVPKHYTITQERYATVSSTTKQERTVIVKINGNVDSTTKALMPVIGTAASQLTIRYIRPGHYYLKNLKTGTEHTGRDQYGHYEANSADVCSYSGTTYTLELLSRYNVKFNANGGTGSMDNQPFIWNESKSLIAENFFCQKKITFVPNNGQSSYDLNAAESTFLGWATSANGAVKYSNNQSVSNLYAKPGGTYNLYAQWNWGSITLPSAPENPGYVFKGWSDGTNTYAANQTITPTTDMKLTAQWEADTYTITFDYNGGTGNSTTDYPVTYGKGSYCDVHWLYPSRAGYVFKGWYTAPTGGTQVYGGDGLCISGAYWNSSSQWIGTSDLTVYAQWQPIYKVTLDNQTATTSGTTAYWYIHNTVLDGVYYYTDEECTTALSNYTITKPTKTGYIFGGYYTDKDGAGTQYVDADGVCINNRYQVAGDVTLYAKWMPINYTIKYNGNPTTYGSTDDSTHTYGVEKALTANGYKRSGYKFMNWNTMADGSGESFADQANVKDLTTTDGATVTLYAQWKPIYKITLDSQEQTIEAKNFYFVYTLDDYYSDNVCITALEDNKIEHPTKVGYIFEGYYTETNGAGTKYIDKEGKISSTCCQLNGDTTLYAYWKPITYTITYQYNDGITQDSKQTYNYETDVVLIAPERVGYTFLGWTNLSKGQGNNNWQYTNYDVGQHPGYYQYGDVTLIARWEINNYTITYDLDGGTLPEGKTNPTSYFVTSDNITLNNPTKEGYTFAGWTGTDLTCKTHNVTIAQGTIGNREYTANWTENTITITYNADANGKVMLGTSGSEATSANEAIGVWTGVLEGATAVPEQGYKFIGWYKSDGTLASTDQTLNLTKNDSEMWQAATYTAKFELAVVNLTIKASGADSNQSYIFIVSGNPSDGSTFTTMKVVLTKENNFKVVIKDVPVGVYKVEEVDEWSWRETILSFSNSSNQTNSYQEVLLDEDKIVEFDFDIVDRIYWLSGLSHGIWKGGSN